MKLTNYDDSVGMQAVVLFQRVLGRKFPKDYLDFILRYNGGKPVPSNFDFLNSDGGSSVRYFLKINSTENYDDLLWNIRNYEERMPTQFIPIAADYGGNCICLAISGKEYGQVFLWDHELEVNNDEKPAMDNMNIVANDFQSFLEVLKE